MSDRYGNSFPPEVWAAANFDEINPNGNPVVSGIRMIEAWRKAWTREGREDERERIIALLESEVWDSPEIATPYVQHIIALIKDERA